MHVRSLNTAHLPFSRLYFPLMVCVHVPSLNTAYLSFHQSVTLGNTPEVSLTHLNTYHDGASAVVGTAPLYFCGRQKVTLAQSVASFSNTYNHRPLTTLATACQLHHQPPHLPSLFR